MGRKGGRTTRPDDSSSSRPDPREARFFLVGLVAIGVLAALLRLGAALESADAPYHRHLVLDAATYHSIALEGDPEGPFWQPPGYPWTLRAVYRVLGEASPLAVRVLQGLLGALACVLIALAGRRLATWRAGLAAGAAMALTGTLVYFDNELLPASLGVLVVSAWIFLLSARASARAWRLVRLPLAGLIVGVGGVLLPTLAFPAALVLLWLARREGMRAALVFALACLVPILPVTLRNYAHEPALVPVSWNGGINFYIGNNAGYPATVAIRPGIDWNRLVAEPLCEGRAPLRADESSYFYSKGLDYAKSEPLAWIGDLARKAASTLSAREIGRNRDLYQARGESLVLRVLLQPWGLPFLPILAAAAIGACALARRREVPALPLLVAAGILVGSVAFFPTARYRAPAIPALLLVAAAGLPRARRGDLVAGLVALGVALVPPGIPRVAPAETFSEIGSQLDQQKRHQESIPFYRKALELDPGAADTHLYLALALGRVGDESAARRHLERALELRPDASLVHQALGLAQTRAGELETGEASLRRAAELDPCNPDAEALLAQVLMEQGRYNEALGHIEAAERIRPRGDSTVRRARQRYDAFRERSRGS